MDTLLERLSSGQIVAVISIVVGGIVALALIIAITRYQFQSLADDTELRQEKQQADLTLRDKLIERREAAGERTSIAELLALGHVPIEAGKADSELAKRFGMLDASANDIEQGLKMALAADAEQKKLIVSVMDELLESGAESEAILAATRPLCSAATPARVKTGCAGAAVG